MMTLYQKKERRRQRRHETKIFANEVFQWFYDDIFTTPNNDAYYRSFHNTPTLHLAALVKAGRRIAYLALAAQYQLDKRYYEQRINRFYQMMGAFTYVNMAIPCEMPITVNWRSIPVKIVSNQQMQRQYHGLEDVERMADDGCPNR